MLFYLILVTVTMVEGSYRAPPHQNLFCRKNSTALRVLVTSKDKDTETSVTYMVKNIEPFKPGAERIKCVVSEEDYCGFIKEDLVVGKQYILTGVARGRTLYISLCSSNIVPYNQMTDRQKSNYAGNYTKNCECQFKYCAKDDNCQPGTDKCYVHYLAANCYDKYSLCEKTANGCLYIPPEYEKDYDSYCDVIIGMTRHFPGKKK